MAKIPSGSIALGIWIAAVLLMTGVGASAQRIDVTPEQRQQLKSIGMETRRKMQDARDTLRRARMDLFQVYRDYNLDERKARSARERISRAQRELLGIHLDNQIALRSKLNADQFAEFRGMMKGRIHGPEAGVRPPRQESLLDNIMGKESIRSLGLNPDQAKRLEQLWRKVPQKAPIFQKLRRDSESLADLYSNYSLDVASARRLIDAIHQDQKQLSDITNARQQVIRSVLTSDQFKRLRYEIEKKIKERRRGEGRWRRHGGP
ncbi:MAG: hypothetical protein M1133_14650 [Armatimonadetes bacterium]|nr:hypothetical protein [Armatimonadota bacterium]